MTNEKDKCIVSGCNIPPRSRLTLPGVFDLAVCGIHAKPVMEALRGPIVSIPDAVDALVSLHEQIATAINEIGDHTKEAEAELKGE
jgi:hypothetical protein